jgi:hypothetical protein
VETTINDARNIRVFRTPENKPDAAPSWLRLRKGVADLHRRAEVSQKANERYFESMATVEAETPLGEAMRDICQPTAINLPIMDASRSRRYSPLKTLATNNLHNLRPEIFAVQQETER